MGGKAFSPHQVCLGKDVTYKRPPVEHVRREWARRLGLVCIVEGDHDHLQPHGWMPG